jgi:hypothetical protein
VIGGARSERHRGIALAGRLTSLSGGATVAREQGHRGVGGEGCVQARSVESERAPLSETNHDLLRTARLLEIPRETLRVRIEAPR